MNPGLMKRSLSEQNPAKTFLTERSLSEQNSAKTFLTERSLNEQSPAKTFLTERNLMEPGPDSSLGSAAERMQKKGYLPFRHCRKAGKF